MQRLATELVVACQYASSQKKHLVKANHTFVTIGAGIQHFTEFRDWLRAHHPRYLDLFELGPGNLVRFKQTARARWSELGAVSWRDFLSMTSKHSARVPLTPRNETFPCPIFYERFDPCSSSHLYCARPRSSFLYFFPHQKHPCIYLLCYSFLPFSSPITFIPITPVLIINAPTFRHHITNLSPFFVELLFVCQLLHIDFQLRCIRPDFDDFRSENVKSANHRPLFPSKSEYRSLIGWKTGVRIAPLLLLLTIGQTYRVTSTQAVTTILCKSGLISIKVESFHTALLTSIVIYKTGNSPIWEGNKVAMSIAAIIPNQESESSHWKLGGKHLAI